MGSRIRSLHWGAGLTDIAESSRRLARRIAPGNRLFVVCVLLVALGVFLAGGMEERRVRGVLHAGGPDAAEVYASFYQRTGMTKRGLGWLSDQLEGDGQAEPAFFGAAARLIASEERRYPGRAGLGLARLSEFPDEVESADPRIARAFWHADDYERATEILGDLLREGLDAGAGLRERDRLMAEFYLADSMKLSGRAGMAEQWLGLMGTDDRIDGKAWTGVEAAGYAAAARGELHTARNRELTLSLTPLGIHVVYEEDNDPDVLQDLLLWSYPDPQRVRRLPLGQPWHDDDRRTARLEGSLLGPVLGATRLNHLFLHNLRARSGTLSENESGAHLRLEMAGPHLSQPWWNGQLLEAGRDLPQRVLGRLNLPMGSRGEPMTVTIRGEGVSLVSWRPVPLRASDGEVVWRFGDGGLPVPQAVEFTAVLDPFQHTLFGLQSRYPLLRGAARNGFVIVLVLVALLIYWIRRQSLDRVQNGRRVNALEAVGALGLAILIADLVLVPTCLLLLGGRSLELAASNWVSTFAGVGYGGLGIACAVFLLRDAGDTATAVRFNRRLAALLFSGYLAVRLGQPVWWAQLLVGLVLAPLVFDRAVGTIKAAEILRANAAAPQVVAARPELLGLLILRLQAERARASLSDFPRRLAEGKVGAGTYHKVREELDGLHQAALEAWQAAGRRVGLGEDAPDSAVLGVGPMAQPWRNAMVAVAIGLLPALLLSYATGRREAMLYLVYLFFFGGAFRLLRGNSGAAKATGFSLGLMAVLVLPGILAAISYQAALALLLEGLLLVLLLIFCGFMMDVVSAGSRWRKLLELYDAPAITGVAGGVITAVVTVITRSFTDGFGEIVNLLWSTGGNGGPGL